MRAHSKFYKIHAYIVKIQMACKSINIPGSTPSKENTIKYECVLHFHNVNRFYETWSVVF
jgi:hypothetical protein